MEQKSKYATRILVPALDKPGDRGAFIRWRNDSLKYPPRFNDFPGQQVIIRAVYTEPERTMITVHDGAYSVYVTLQLLAVTPLVDGGWLAALRFAPEIPDHEEANLPTILRFLTHEQAAVLTAADLQKWEAQIDVLLQDIDKGSEIDKTNQADLS